MDFIKARCETLVKCRSNVYYGNDVKEGDAACAAFAGGEFKETKIDEYRKFWRLEQIKRRSNCLLDSNKKQSNFLSEIHMTSLEI